LWKNVLHDNRDANISMSQSQSHIATDGQSVCLGVEPNLVLLTRVFFSPKKLLPSRGGKVERIAHDHFEDTECTVRGSTLRI
jgi:hypothetical protein